MKKIVIVTLLILVFVFITGCTYINQVTGPVKSVVSDQCKNACDNPALIKPLGCTCSQKPTPIPVNVTPTSEGK